MCYRADTRESALPCGALPYDLRTRRMATLRIRIVREKSGRDKMHLTRQADICPHDGCRTTPEILCRKDVHRRRRGIGHGHIEGTIVDEAVFAGAPQSPFTQINVDTINGPRIRE